LGTNLAHAGQGLKQSRNLHLAQDVVAVGLSENLREVGPTALEAFLELGPGTSGGGRLLQRSGPLLLGQLGKGHGLLRRLLVLRNGLDWCGDRIPRAVHRSKRGATPDLPRREFKQSCRLVGDPPCGVSQGLRLGSMPQHVT
jgi:hypothetical protein